MAERHIQYSRLRLKHRRLLFRVGDCFGPEVPGKRILKNIFEPTLHDIEVKRGILVG